MYAQVYTLTCTCTTDCIYGHNVLFLVVCMSVLGPHDGHCTLLQLVCVCVCIYNPQRPAYRSTHIIVICITATPQSWQPLTCTFQVIFTAENVAMLMLW